MQETPEINIYSYANIKIINISLYPPLIYTGHTRDIQIHIFIYPDISRCHVNGDFQCKNQKENSTAEYMNYPTSHVNTVCSLYSVKNCLLIAQAEMHPGSQNMMQNFPEAGIF